MEHPLITKLEKIAVLTSEEKRVLVDATSRTRQLEADQHVAREGERPAECHLLLDGFVCRYKMLPEGKRQIIGFQVAGDFCDLTGFVLGRMDHSVATVTAATLAVVPYRTLEEIAEQHPQLARALWQETLIDASIAREWVANVGSRSAYQRVAHLLCEMGLRLKNAGRAVNGSFEWPLTQAEVADATGLSTVHVNRTLQRLRDEDLIELSGRQVVVPNWDMLQQAGEFRADYLFIRPQPGQTGASRG